MAVVFWALVAFVSTADAQTFPADGAYVAVQCGGADATDGAGDVAGATGWEDVVGAAGDAALSWAVDDTDAFFRLRVAADAWAGAAYQPSTWGIEIDVDGVLDDYEYGIFLDGVAAIDQVVVAGNDAMAVLGDPADDAETDFFTYDVATNARSTPAGSAIGGAADYFVTIAVPLADLATVGADPARGLVVWAGTSTDGRSLDGDLACHDGGAGAPSLADFGSEPVLLDPDGDPDADGLDNAGELAAGTNPRVRDSDGDGVPDGDEVAAGTDPLDADTDDDGMGDVREAEEGTDPLDPDSDDDGLLDGAEDAACTDPQVADTDGDGLVDGDEVNRTGSDPCNADTDGDRLSDSDEDRRGTDPRDGDSDDGGENDGAEVGAGRDPLDPADDFGGGGDADTDSDTDADADADTGDTLEDHELVGGGILCSAGPGSGDPRALGLIGIAIAISRWRRSRSTRSPGASLRRRDRRTSCR